MPKANVCVIGAGVSGLSTAYYLLSKYPEQLAITIVADRYSPNTTSDVAFGLWEPYLIADTPVHKVKQWSMDTLSYMVDLANSAEAAKAGCFILSGHTIYTKEFKIPSWNNEAVNFRLLTEKELKSLHPGFRYGYSFTSAVCECRYYLPYLMDKIKQLGGTFQQRKLKSIEELCGNYDVIVNCSGLGSLTLATEKDMNPIRGQVIRVKAPWVKNFLMDNERNFYILPGRDTVVLGGSAEVGEWKEEISQETKARIFRGCCEIMPSLQEATVVEDCVGLRPGRSRVRVESGIITYQQDTKSLKQRVVHNYGHAGSGIGLHWGCAKEASELVMESLIPNHKL